MFRNLCSRLLQVGRTKPDGIRRINNLFEPDYLAELQPKVPIYPLINFQIKGYDFAILESYHRFMNRTANTLDLEVNDNWALPPKHLQVSRLKDKSNTVEAEFQLQIYERTMQISDLEAHVYPIYFRLLQAALPEGVSLNVVPHDEHLEEVRYVPDTQLKELREQLDELGGARKPKRKK